MGQRADEIVPRGDDGTELWTPTPPSHPEIQSISLDPEGKGDDEIDERRIEIERTRSELSGTIDALQERLAPQHLVDQAKDAARETTTSLVEEAKEALRDGTIRKAEQMVSEVEDTAREVRTTLVGLIQENPIPAAMAGIGLGWLFMNRGAHSTPTRGYAPRGYADSNGPPGYHTAAGRTESGLGATVGQAQERAGELVGQARDAAGQLVSDAGDLATDASGAAAHLATSAGSTARGAGSTLWETVAQNPVPAALAGASLTWLWMRRANGGMSAPHLAESSVSLGELTDRAKGQFEDLGSGAQFHAQRAQGQFERMLQETPLAVGAVALGLGAAIGLAVPPTAREGELMGGARDTLMEKAQQAAQDAQQRIQEVGEQVQQAAKQEVHASDEPHSDETREDQSPRNDERGYGQRLAS